jgi:hypothetical protein
MTAASAQTSYIDWWFEAITWGRSRSMFSSPMTLTGVPPAHSIAPLKTRPAH